MTTKAELRQQAKILRKNLQQDICSEKIVSHILNWEKFNTAKNIMLYYPVNNEINLLSLPDDKTYFLPKVVENNIQVCPFVKNRLVNGKFGIPEPAGETVENLNILDIIFIPALAADVRGYRIGYGGGYYDRFLQRLNNRTIKVIPLYSKLLLENIPTEPHDIKADFIVTENEIFSTSVKTVLS